MFSDKWLLVEIVLTLAGTGTAMYVVRDRLKGKRFANLLAVLTGVGLLCLLHLFGLLGARYILMSLLVLSALAFFLGQM